jgi:hypothetical protein
MHWNVRICIRSRRTEEKRNKRYENWREGRELELGPMQDPLYFEKEKKD